MRLRIHESGGRASVAVMSWLLSITMATGCLPGRRAAREGGGRVLLSHVVCAAWAPDGDGIGVIIGSDLNPWKRRLAVCHADGEGLRFVGEPGFWVGPLVWKSDGRELFVNLRETASRLPQVWQVSVYGETSRRLTRSGGLAFGYRAGADELLLVMERDGIREFDRLSLPDKRLHAVPAAAAPLSPPAYDMASDSILYASAIEPEQPDSMVRLHLLDLAAGTDSVCVPRLDAPAGMTLEPGGARLAVLALRSDATCLALAARSGSSLVRVVRCWPGSGDMLAWPDWRPGDDRLLMVDHAHDGQLISLTME
ncbi:hypothetical protein JW905_08255 [bacterium]|nr:hypothetical protein [candidate division CSSED10-310 bacterium]